MTGDRTQARPAHGASGLGVASCSPTKPRRAPAQARERLATGARARLATGSGAAGPGAGAAGHWRGGTASPARLDRAPLAAAAPCWGG
jgi:hypothetical protein